MQRDAGPDLRPLQRLAWPGFVLDLGAGELLAADGRPTELRAQALKVLLILGERAGQVVGKDELMRRVWGDVIVTEDSLVQAIGDIRRVLGDQAHDRIRTVPRRGYLLMAEPPAAVPLRRRRQSNRRLGHRPPGPRGAGGPGQRRRCCWPR